jgi:hypothetical protein
MKSSAQKTGKSFFILFFLLATISLSSIAQRVSFYQFRKVPDNKIDEFVKRETTYWSKVAQKAIDSGVMQFWGLFEKVSGGDGDGPNYLFVNSFDDIDKAFTSNIFDPSKTFPSVPISKIETNSMSSVTNTMITHPMTWEQSSKAVPEKDFNFVLINYHTPREPGSFITLEQKHWQPFIKKLMDDGKTNQMAWGNEVILSPVGGKYKATTISIDLYRTFKDALMPNFGENTKFPEEGLAELDKLTTEPRTVEIYRVVKVVTK